MARGDYIKCKLIGVLHLLDNGENDDKLIAISSDSPLYELNLMSQLDSNYSGITTIIELWFSNYKGPRQMLSKGYGDKNEANQILEAAIEEYRVNNASNP